MSTMREQLVDRAIGLVRVRGYADFSYADLAQAVGISKPSIHHHFPTKEDLGLAIVDAYGEAYFAHLAAIDAAGGDRRRKIAAFAGIYREALKAGQACLCGMLASEVAILPERVRAGVARFFEGNVRWLEAVLADDGAGAKRQARRGGRRSSEARTLASLVLSTVQGALFVARTSGNAQVFEDAVLGVLGRLEARPE